MSRKKPEMLVHINLKEPVVTASYGVVNDQTVYRMAQNLHVAMMKNLDDGIIKAAKDYFKQTKCTDLVLLDGDEMERRLRIAHAWDRLKDVVRAESTEALFPDHCAVYHTVLELMEKMEQEEMAK